MTPYIQFERDVNEDFQEILIPLKLAGLSARRDASSVLTRRRPTIRPSSRFPSACLPQNRSAERNPPRDGLISHHP